MDFFPFCIIDTMDTTHKDPEQNGDSTEFDLAANIEVLADIDIPFAYAIEPDGSN